MSAATYRVVIAGSGIAGLEALLALRVHAGSRVQITLVTDAVHRIDRAMSVAEPFDGSAASPRDIAAIANDQGADLHLQRLISVDPGRRVARLSGGELAYDALIVATGARPQTVLPGAMTFRGRRDVRAMRRVRDDLLHGVADSAAFVIPARSVWPLPLYELALMTAADLRAHHRDARVTILTPETAPLDLFGSGAAHALTPLLEQLGVQFRACTQVTSIDDVDAERIVTLALARGRPPAGLASDRHGFLTCDAHGRLEGVTGVYAAGDATAFPLKQGGLAAQQADAVAEAIAADAGVAIDPKPFVPVIRGLLLTGGQPLYMRAEIGGEDGTVAWVGPRSDASLRALWWPPAKVAARYLGPYLASAHKPVLAPKPLIDRPAPASGAPATQGQEELQLVLTLADADASCGDYDAALRALDTARAASGTLPPAYERKRELWLAHTATA